MRNPVFVALTLLVATGAAMAAGQSDFCTTYGRFELGKFDIQNIGTDIAEQMPTARDAQLQDVVAAVGPDGEILVCGMFNVRNLLGAYEGFQPFNGYLSIGRGGNYFMIENYGPSAASAGCNAAASVNQFPCKPAQPRPLRRGEVESTWKN